MRTFRLLAVFLLYSGALSGQLEPIEKYFEKLWEKWAAERTARKVEGLLHDQAAIKSISERHIDLKRPPEFHVVARSEETEAELRKERKLEDDIKACTDKVLFLDPFKRAVKAANKAAVTEFGKSSSTLESIYQVADSAFNDQVLKEFYAFRDNPEKKLADDMTCVLNRRVKGPIQRAVAKCLVTMTLRDQNCFENALDN